MRRTENTNENLAYRHDRKLIQLQATVAQQQRDFQAAIVTLKETVTAQINEQAAQIQKVSAQLAAASASDGGLAFSKPGSRMVANGH